MLPVLGKRNELGDSPSAGNDCAGWPTSAGPDSTAGNKARRQRWIGRADSGQASRRDKGDLAVH